MWIADRPGLVRIEFSEGLLALLFGTKNRALNAVKKSYATKRSSDRRTDRNVHGQKGAGKPGDATIAENTPGIRMTQVVEYPLTDEEKIKHAGKLRDKVVTVGIREMSVFGGRLRCRGELLDPSLVAKAGI